MKKTLLLPMLSLAMFICISKAWSQKIYKSTAHSAAYARTINPAQKPVEQNVYSDFSANNEVTVIDFSGTELKSPPSVYLNSVKKNLKHGEFFTITNKAAMQALLQQQPGVLTMIIPFNNKKIILDLVKSNIFSDEFKVTTNESETPVPVHTGVYYSGIVRGESSLVSISFFASHVEGLISYAGKAPVELGKMRNSKDDNVHVIYSGSDLLKKRDFVCGTPPPTPEYLEQMKAMERVSLEAAGKKLKCVTNYWETSYNLYQYFGSTQEVTDFVTTLFHSFATLYTNENIGMKLNETNIWTKTDPYENSLYTFSSERSRFNGDLAMLLSTTGGGGVAWLNAVCNPDRYYHHSFCGSITSDGADFPDLPDFSWPVEVTTHEVGHNLGSPHTHACAWNGNNTAIDGCGPAAGYNEGCNAALPLKGSIMSYCHLVSSVGIDLALGFENQPGDLIRGQVSSCITLKCAPTYTSCTPPSDVTVSDLGKKAATVSWKKVDKAEYYYVYSSKDKLKWKLEGDFITGKTFTIDKLTPDTKYYCQVGVACKNGQSLLSSTVNFTTLSSLPLAEARTAEEKSITPGSKTVQVVPNPAQGGKFIVQLPKGMENATVQIVNMMGQPIASDNNKGLQRNFNLENARGSYFAKVINGNEVVTIKVLLQ